MSEIRYERYEESRRVSDGRPVGPAESEEIESVDGVPAREVIGIVVPLVRPCGGMETVNEEECRSASSSRERYPMASPIEAAFLPTDEVGELVNTLSRKRVVDRGGTDNGTARDEYFPPAVIALQLTPPSAAAGSSASTGLLAGPAGCSPSSTTATASSR